VLLSITAARTSGCSRSTRPDARGRGGPPRRQHHFGAVIDDTLGDEVKVTVIAARLRQRSFPYKKVDGASRRRRADGGAYRIRPTARQPGQRQPNPANGRPNPGHGAPIPGNGAPAAHHRGNANPGAWRPSSGDPPTPVNLDETDVPDFLKCDVPPSAPPVSGRSNPGRRPARRDPPTVRGRLATPAPEVNRDPHTDHARRCPKRVPASDIAASRRSASRHRQNRDQEARAKDRRIGRSTWRSRTELAFLGRLRPTVRSVRATRTSCTTSTGSSRKALAAGAIASTAL